MKRLFITYMLTCSFTLFTRLPLQAQSEVLTVNSSVPNLVFENVVNAPYQKISLKQLKNKAVLIEYWSTICGVCLIKMYDLAKLQRQFKDDLFIMTVAAESKENVEYRYQRNPELKALGLPSVTGEKDLLKLFPARAVPHLIWIGKDRKVKAITDGEAANGENITRFLKNESLSDLPLKNDRVDFDFDGISLLTNGPVVQEQVLAGSLLTGKIDVPAGRISISTIGSLHKVSVVNQPPLNLYAFAYKQQMALNPTNIKTQIALVGTPGIAFTDSANKPRSYCYELLLPVKESAKKDLPYVLRYMQKDLDRLFGVTSRVQKMPKECYVFVPVKRVGEANDDQQSIIPMRDSTRFLNTPIKRVLDHIKTAYSFELPVVYDPPEDSRVSVVLTNSFSDLKAVQDALHNIGYDLKQENRLIEMLVLE